MSRGGKGKISNDLVAASCAAVLAVYAAGYSRTRDAARKLEMQAREPRLAVRTMPAEGLARPPAVAALPAREPSAPVATASAATAPGVPLPPMPKPAAPRHVRHRRSSAPATTAPTSAAPAMAAEAGSSPAAGPPAIAPVPLPEEIAPPAAPPVVATGPAVPEAKWRDGTYTGVGDSAHGDIEARVVIKGGRIVEAGISSCGTRYPCSVIDSIIHQPVERQSPKVDYVSHSTESSYAYYFGLVEALKAALDPAAGEATDPK